MPYTGMPDSCQHLICQGMYGYIVMFSTGVEKAVDTSGNGTELFQINDQNELWKRCTQTMRTMVSEAVWNTWLANVRCDHISSSRVTLVMSSVIVKSKIESTFLPLLRNSIEECVGGIPEIELLVRQHDKNQDKSTAPPQIEDVREKSSLSGVQNGNQYHTTTSRDNIELDYRYTFDNFVIGPSNRFAHAAAMAVAESPARSYNPLLIHGSTGLGKTHLLHAIGNYIHSTTNSVIRYVSTEQFLNEFVEAIRNNTQIFFKKHYRECDVLLVDDIQFLGGKEQLQEEFFYTFADLYGASKQLVFTSDKPPNSLSTLEHRLRSRFMSGLITDVQPPELETRIAILQNKSQLDHITVPQDIYEFIAAHVTTNIRELEGALTRVTAYARLTNKTLDMEMAKSVLNDIFTSTVQIITPEKVISIVATQLGYKPSELSGPARNRPLVRARQLAMYLIRELTDYSYPAIARHFGDRDHTTVIHAVEKINKDMNKDRELYDQIMMLTKMIKEYS